MSEFSAHWLALREPADARARSLALVTELVAHLDGGSSSHALPRRPLRILDLGTGTGANARELMPRLPMPQHWCLVDRNVELLRDLTKRLAAWALDRGAIANGSANSFALRGPAHDVQCDTVAIDLAKLTQTNASGSFAPLFGGSALITASALLDLVSEDWLETLVGRCAAARACALFVLTYDGRMSCTPRDADDEWIRTLVNQHQRTAKGFGKALGPDATAYAARLFTVAGYHVSCAASDWQVPPHEDALQRALIEGWAAAAAEMSAASRDRVAAWLERRVAYLDAGSSEISVGHQDLAAWPDA